MLERYRRAPPPQPLDIHLQGDSLGIHYEGYEKTFIQCIFEEGDVEGKNERYEFRCDSKYECCGRVCCVPENAIIPLWLMIIFIILALLALLALLGTIAYLCAKRRQKPKKQVADYSTLAQSSGDKSGDRALLAHHEPDMYSTPDFTRGGGYGYGGAGSGYRNNGLDYGYGRDGYGAGGGADGGGGYGRSTGAPPLPPRRRADSRGSVSDDGSVVRRGVTETFEESFKQEITYEKAASTDSKEML